MVHLTGLSNQNIAVNTGGFHGYLDYNCEKPC